MKKISFKNIKFISKILNNSKDSRIKISFMKEIQIDPTSNKITY